MGAEVITLDPAQAAALRGAATESITATGADGTGKSTLAMAIAAQAAAAGRSCLLVGKSVVLDNPSPFRMLSQVHPILFQRAHFRDSTTPSRVVSTEFGSARGSSWCRSLCGAHRAGVASPRARPGE